MSMGPRNEKLRAKDNLIHLTIPTRAAWVKAVLWELLCSSPMGSSGSLNCCVTNDYKCRGLKWYPLWFHSSVGQKPRWTWLGSLLMASWGTEVQVWAGLGFYLELLGRSWVELLSGRPWEGLSGCWKQWFFVIVGLKFLFPCRLPAMGCPKFLLFTWLPPSPKR